MATHQIDGAVSIFLVKEDGTSLAVNGRIPVNIVADSTANVTTKQVDGAMTVFLVKADGTGLDSAGVIPAGEA